MSGHPDDLLEAYAFGDCADPSVAAHVGSCGSCVALVAAAVRVAGWLGAAHFETPPASLRSRVVTAARSARAPSDSSALDAYAAEVASLGSLLNGLSPADWRAPVLGGRTVAVLVSHLAANDAQVSADLGLPPSPPLSAPAAHWRVESDRLLRIVGSRNDLLGHPVRLAGRVPMRRPLREALTQRAFETWIHDSDVRAAVSLPPVAPSPVHLARIVAFGLTLLPGAMDLAGRGRPGASVTLQLTGPGGGAQVVSLSGADPGRGRPVAGVRMPAERFGRLMAGRVPVAESAASIDGDRAVALDLLTVAATLGCE
ncbi:maleylpyruvate isomerase family mycothiol-dependent enzyme [Actinoplanes sp. NPDC026619]|uniref:maleylpyruvate isomerase family mycothiol-dependent enzyme n=1 Tax=Actinoplanes sp. NPDC026619 TaxID=3155798 RepID=UPI0033D74789